MMVKKYFKDLNTFSVLVAVIVGVFSIGGAIGGWLSLYDWYKNRSPDLNLFVPYNWSGIDAGTRKSFLCLYLRIANSSQKSTYLYLETMSVSLKIKDKWYATYIADLPAGADKVTTDFPESEQRRFGLSKARYLNRFEDNIVAFDKPLSGYVIVGHDNDAIINNDFDKIKIEIEDSHRKKYTLYADLEKQLESDPHNKYLESLDKSKEIK